MISDRVSFENAGRFEDDCLAAREKQAVQTQNLFRRVTGKAEWKGMKVNAAKTKMLCVSDALSFLPGSYIEIGGDVPRITSGGREDTMKLLGFTLSNRPGVGAHVDALRRRFRQRYWVIIHLRTFGFTPEELVRVYKTVVRPTAEYCAAAYHSPVSYTHLTLPTIYSV